MNTTKWYVKPIESGGKTFYQVRRQVAKDGNPKEKITEKCGEYYSDRIDAKRLAKLLNKEAERARSALFIDTEVTKR